MIDKNHTNNRSVDRCIASYRSPLLRSLHLRIFSSRAASRWLRFAALRSVTDLRLNGPYRPKVNITVPVFSCRALVSLDLSGLLFPPIDGPNFSGFSCLANLTISFCGNDDATLGSLLSNCPSLITLELESCHKVTTLQLSSSKLARLKVLDCRALHVSVDAPNLTSITFYGNVGKLYLKSTGPLLETTIGHIFRGMHEDYDTVVRWTRPVVSVSHESTNPMAIDWLFNNMFPQCILPLFKNPKVLHHDLLWVTPPFLTGLVSMLQHYPNLEQLHINLSHGIRNSVMLFKQELLLRNRGQDKPREYMDRIARLSQVLN